MSLWSTLGKIGGAIGGTVIGGPIGGAIGLIGGAMSGGGSKTTMPAAPRIPTGTFAPTGTGLKLPGAPPTIAMPGTGFAAPVPVPTSSGSSGGSMSNGSCNVGYRKNKSRYYHERTIGGVKTGGISIIEPGEKCVKRRRMNPLNPKAASRAIRRLESLHKATKRFNRITVRSKCGCK